MIIVIFIFYNKMNNTFHYTLIRNIMLLVIQFIIIFTNTKM